MHKKHIIQSILTDKDHFAVTVYPNVDYAFIVALIAILNEINEDGDWWLDDYGFILIKCWVLYYHFFFEVGWGLYFFVYPNVEYCIILYYHILLN